MNCDLHPSESAEYYSKYAKKLICQKCVIDTYRDQLSECTPIDRDRIREEMDKAFEKLVEHREKLNDVIEEVQSLLS